jgi:adenylate cyclase
MTISAYYSNGYWSEFTNMYANQYGSGGRVEAMSGPISIARATGSGVAQHATSMIWARCPQVRFSVLEDSTLRVYIAWMPEERTNRRRLAAILAADVVGYSKMMAIDEVATLTALRAHREALFNPAVERHRGRIFKLMGDGTLVEFPSVVDAVKCAIDIQLRSAEQADSDTAISLRIGVNLGDVIIDDDDIYGDGVNIAARLEPLADPGGVCIASIVNESVGSRIDIQFEDGGQVRVKNIDRPIHVWKWKPGGRALPPATVRSIEADREPATASIAVLPFDNMSGDPEQEYFSDGITEDLITDLSKVAGLMVIARNSSFAYKGKSVDVRVIGRELGVSSVLEGSIRKAGNRVRITAQLIDAVSGGHVWADRFDRDLTDIFEVQDEVTREIVEALKVTLSSSEIERLKDVGTKSIKAHDLYLRGRELMQGSINDRQGFQEALSAMEQAIEADPGYAAAYGGLAGAYMYDYLNRWSDDPDSSLAKADELAQKSVALDPNESFGYAVLAWTAGSSGDSARALAATEKAIELSPNSAMAHSVRGVHEIYAGDPADAIPAIETAMRLDPVDIQQSLHFLGMAHLLLAHYETAAALFRQRIAAVPDTDMSRSMLASALGHQGETEEAKSIWAELMEINPRYSFAEHMNRAPFADPKTYEPIAEGLRMAGLID